MEDEKKVNYVTKEEFLMQLGVIWSYIMLTLQAMMWGDQVFQMGLCFVSFLMFVMYLGAYYRVLNRRKRRGMG